MQRLEAAGWLYRTPLVPGMGGPMLSITEAGAMQGDIVGNWPASPVAPTWWAHWSACAWVTAWFDLRGKDWLGGWELREDPSWSATVRWRDHRGNARSGHRPDLIGSGCAVEVELSRKIPARLAQIVKLYREWTDAGRIRGAVYVVDSPAMAQRITEVAEGERLPVTVRQLADVVQETRDAREAINRTRET